MTKAIHVEATVHGRILVRESAAPAGVIAILHGYAQSAEDALNDIEGTPGLERWTIVAIQALHPFYARGGRDAGGDKVVAGWMTRQDRDLAVADNVAYVDRAIEAVNPLKTQDPSLKTVFVGFSQGASMAYRAAMLGRHEPAGIVALAGDIPPEVRAAQRRMWPRVLIGVGDGELWYTAPKLESDVNFLMSAGTVAQVVRFAGKHEWTQEFRNALGSFLEMIAPSTPVS
jgi:predicted esterase